MLLLGTPVGLTAPPNTVDGVHFHVGSTTCNPGVCPQLDGNRIARRVDLGAVGQRHYGDAVRLFTGSTKYTMAGIQQRQSLMGNDRSGSRSLLVSTALIGRVALASSIACVCVWLGLLSYIRSDSREILLGAPS
jgi:hypothetical protein